MLCDIKGGGDVDEEIKSDRKEKLGIEAKIQERIANKECDEILRPFNRTSFEIIPSLSVAMLPDVGSP